MRLGLSSPAGALGEAAPFVAAYAVGLYFGLVLLSPLGISALWTPNGVLACALLLLDRRAGWTCVAACTLVHVAMAIGLGSMPFKVLVMAPVNLAEILAMAWLTRRVCGPNLNFSDGRRLMRLVFGAVIPACGGAALLLGASRAWFPVPTPVGAHTPLLWAISHSLGSAMVIPAVAAIARRRRYAAMQRSPTEFGAAMTLVLLVSAALFRWSTEPAGLYLIFPVMMLTAFRYGPVGAATGSLILALMCAAVVYSGLQSLPVYGVAIVQSKMAWMQVFVAVVFLTTMSASGAVASYARMRTLLARRTENARHARNRADSAGAAKCEFLANMSHEIRTPLNGVLGLADSLSRTDLTPPQREMIGMILSSGTALTGLLSDALDLARADSGALKLSEEAFDVRETLLAATRPFEAIARDKGLAFDVGFDLAPPGAAMGDALRIRQIVSNLTSNAVKFTAEGSVEVEVSLVPLDSGRLALRASVRDTGQGFGPAVQARLFNRFEQGDNSVTRRHGGSGLGLSIAHRLAELMGGRITCGSIVGEGSVFTFEAELARAAAGAVAVARAGAASAPAGAPPRRLAVLLAEDHPVNRKVIEAMLGDTVDLTCVEDGRAAVEACAARRFDAVLMDTHMPVMDGLSAIRAIRAGETVRGQPWTPIVSLTADAMSEQVRDALAAGADLHLAKPITGDALAAALAACERLRAPGMPKAVAV